MLLGNAESRALLDDKQGISECFRVSDKQRGRYVTVETPELQHKIQLLVRLCLRDFLFEPQRPLRQIVDEIGREAAAPIIGAIFIGSQECRL